MPRSTTSGITTKSGKSDIDNPNYRLKNLEGNNIFFHPTSADAPQSIRTLIGTKTRPIEGEDRFDFDKDKLILLENNVAETVVEEFFNYEILRRGINLSNGPKLFTSKRISMTTPAIPHRPKESHITTPKPNILCGYKNSTFSNDQHRQLRLLDPSANFECLYYPFLIINFVGEKGNLFSATNQCAGALATSTNLVEKLNKRLQNDKFVDSTAWGIAMNGSEARVLVCWKDGEKFEIRTARVCHFRSENYHILWTMIKNIVDWGEHTRLDEISKALNWLEARGESGVE